MNSLILISTPAGGKGTISEYISKKYGYEHISIGDLLRDEIEQNTKIGKNVKNIVANGKLVDDDVLFFLLNNKLKNQKKNYVLDGTPRILNQAIKYDKLLKDLNINLTRVIFIDTDKKVAKKRMLERLVCENCNKSYSHEFDSDVCEICGKKLTKREDDNANIFDKRYQTFKENTLPVVNYYKEKNILNVIDNNSSLENLFNQVDEILGGITNDNN